MKFKDSQFYVESRLGEHRAFSPEGYLICKEVPLARVGTFLYSAEELGLTDRNANEAVRVQREADELFSAETLASFEGKPVTDGHPVEFASLDNYKEIAKGHAQNVHRVDDKMVADLVITDRQLIEKILSQKAVEISNGYDSEIVEREGEFFQTNFLGNHIAVVERGRCGNSCSIGDSAMKLKDKLLALFKARDEEEFKKEVEKLEDEEEVKEPPKDEPKGKESEKQDSDEKESEKKETKDSASFVSREDVIQIVDECIAKALKAKDEAPKAESKKTEDEAIQVTDAQLKQAIADAEIIAPSIQAPTIKTQDELDAFKRQAMKDSKHAFISAVDTKDMSGMVLDSAFLMAVSSAKAMNNAATPAKANDEKQSYQDMLNDFWKNK